MSRLQQLTRPRLAISLANLLGVVLLLGGLLAVALPSRAQEYEGNLPVDPIRATNYFEPQPAETPYQEQVRILQKQLLNEGKLLNELSVVDPSAYATLQYRLHTYLNQLEEQNPDYGQASVHQSVRRFLLASEEQTKAALAKCRRRLTELTDTLESKTEPLQTGSLALTDYAPLFRKADFRSRRLHVVLPGEQVMPIRKVGHYYLVHCGHNKGYVHEGMMQAAHQENARLGLLKQLPVGE